MSKKSAFVFISICTVLYVFVFRWLWFWTFYSCSVNTSTFCVDVFNFKNVSPSENVAWKRQCKRALNGEFKNCIGFHFDRKPQIKLFKKFSGYVKLSQLRMLATTSWQDSFIQPNHWKTCLQSSSLTTLMPWRTPKAWSLFAKTLRRCLRSWSLAMENK